MTNKPSVLYRGIRVDYNDLDDFEFSGVDLKVNYAPIIDQYGRKTVRAGNEYGVYMSDNLSMVESAYGDLHNDGLSITVIYEINTDGLDIRKPFISQQLSGHYNNGFKGDEWIADLVPANNYKLYRVRIGEDILHDVEDIDLLRVEDVSKEVKQKMEMRKYRLETYDNAIEKMPLKKRMLLGKDEFGILKSIYGKNGLKYINEDMLITSDIDGMVKYLISKVFKQNESDIDFQTIKYINSLNERATDIDSIIEILKNDKIENTWQKVAFEERKRKEGKPYVTSKFDKQEKRLDSLMSMVLYRVKRDNSHKQEQASTNTPIQWNRTKEDQEWDLVKEKYNFDELEPERQIVIEQQFHEMVYKRRMEEIESAKIESTEQIGKKLM